MEILLILFAIAAASCFILILPLQMPTHRNRNGFIRMLISLVGSPLLAALLLITFGPAQIVLSEDSAAS